MHVQMCPAEGTPIYHEIGTTEMVYVGRITLKAGVISLIPCRGITQRQARELYRAWRELLADEDAWEACCVGGLETHVSIPVLDPAESCMPPTTVGLRRLRRSGWRGGRHFDRYAKFCYPCPNVTSPSSPEDCPGDRPGDLVG